MPQTPNDMTTLQDDYHWHDPLALAAKIERGEDLDPEERAAAATLLRVSGHIDHARSFFQRYGGTVVLTGYCSGHSPDLSGPRLSWWWPAMASALPGTPRSAPHWSEKRHANRTAPFRRLFGPPNQRASANDLALLMTPPSICAAWLPSRAEQRVRFKRTTRPARGAKICPTGKCPELPSF